MRCMPKHCTLLRQVVRVQPPASSPPRVPRLEGDLARLYAEVDATLTEDERQEQAPQGAGALWMDCEGIVNAREIDEGSPS